MAVVPTNYDEWEHCITMQCRIPLTIEFVRERIEALQNENDFMTSKFIARWGAEHHQRTIGWFLEAQAKLTQ